MPTPFAQLASLLLGVALALAGNGLLGTLLAVRLAGAGFGPVAVGWILAAYFAGFAAGTQLADRTIVGVGHIRAFAAFVAVLAAVALAHALVPPSWAWAAFRFLAGLSMAGLFMVVESWLNAASSNAIRGRVLSAYMVCVYLGLGCGQLLLTAWPVERLELLCLAAMSFSLAAVPVALTRTVAPTLEHRARMPLRTLRGRAPLGLAAALAAGALAACIYSLAPVYGVLVGLDEADLSLWMSSLVLGGLLLQWPLGRLSDRVDRRRVLLGVALAIAATSGVLSLQASRTVLSLALPAALFGGLVFALYPLGVAHAFDRLDHGEVLAAAAQLLLANALGAVAGPLLAAPIMARVGPPGLFLFSAAVSLLLGAAILARIRSVEPVPVERQEPFVALPGTTPAAAELDPRGHEPSA